MATEGTMAARGGSTHTGFDRRPRFPFLPMTGVPKCSGLVSGSLSSVCAGKMGKLDRRVFGGNRVKSQETSFPIERENAIVTTNVLEMNFAERRETR